MSTIKNPTARITADDFHVSSKNVEFTKEHLELHKSVHNPNTFPEYYTDFQHMGLDYVDTVLMESSKLVLLNSTKTNQVLLGQLYRVGKNPKYNSITTSIQNKGYDLRERPIQVVIDAKGDVFAIFNGNTMTAVLDKTTLQNRIVALYKTNSKYTNANLIAIGTRMNSIENPAGTNSLNDIRFALDNIDAEGVLYLDPRAVELDKEDGKDRIKEWTQRVHDFISFMSYEVNVNSALVTGIINALLEKKVNDKYVLSVRSSKEVLIELRKEGYIDSPAVKYGAYSAFPDKIFGHIEAVYRKSTVESSGNRLPKSDPEYFDFKNGSYELIVHMGTPLTKDPVADFFTKYVKFWEEYNNIKNLIQPLGIPWFKIRGAYQQISLLDEIWPLGSVVPFEELVDYYYNVYINNGVTSKSVLTFIEEEEIIS